MKIVTLVENTTNLDLKVAHGLSLYIQTKKHNILFDVGPDQTIFDNAEALGIDLTSIDTVIISHGHKDHGGALSKFLEINNSAKIYIQRRALNAHYTMSTGRMVNISIDKSFIGHPQFILLDGSYIIDDELELFVVENQTLCHSPANDVLYEESELDDFQHEQNLIIHGDKNALIMGCGHSGVVNIMQQAKMFNPAICIGGYHLHTPNTRTPLSHELVHSITNELALYPDVEFYTCHCTGVEAFEILANRLSNIHYLACGDSINIT